MVVSGLFFLLHFFCYYFVLKMSDASQVVCCSVLSHVTLSVGREEQNRKKIFFSFFYSSLVKSTERNFKFYIKFFNLAKTFFIGRTATNTYKFI